MDAGRERARDRAVRDRPARALRRLLDHHRRVCSPGRARSIRRGAAHHRSGPRGAAPAGPRDAGLRRTSLGRRRHGDRDRTLRDRAPDRGDERSHPARPRRRGIRAPFPPRRSARQGGRCHRAAVQRSRTEPRTGRPRSAIVAASAAAGLRGGGEQRGLRDQAPAGASGQVTPARQPVRLAQHRADLAACRLPLTHQPASRTRGRVRRHPPCASRAPRGRATPPRTRRAPAEHSGRAARNKWGRQSARRASTTPPPRPA